jgi:hypothetical protein
MQHGYKWALLHRANNYRTLPNNELWSVNNRSFGGILVAYFHPISEFCIYESLFESVLKVLQGVKVSVLLHFVVAERSERNLIEAAGERGWRNCVVV